MTKSQSSFALRTVGFLAQLVPLAFIAAYLFLMSKPPEQSSLPGVAQGPFEPRWIYPYSIALALSGIAALKYRTAAMAAGLLTTVALGYGVSTAAEKPPEMLRLSLGTVIAVVAGVSLLGLALRLLGDRQSERHQ